MSLTHTITYQKSLDVVKVVFANLYVFYELLKSMMLELKDRRYLL